jgi:hypothetical protein
VWGTFISLPPPAGNCEALMSLVACQLTSIDKSAGRAARGVRVIAPFLGTGFNPGSSCWRCRSAVFSESWSSVAQCVKCGAKSGRGAPRCLTCKKCSARVTWCSTGCLPEVGLLAIFRTTHLPILRALQVGVRAAFLVTLLLSWNRRE